MEKSLKDHQTRHNMERRRSSIKIIREIEVPDSCYGVRHTQILLLCLLLAIGYGMRVNLSVGIVAMTDPTVNPDFKSYEWHDQSIILSSFFWGYILPQIGAGQVAKRYGPKWFLVATMTICSLFTLIIPWMASFGSWAVMACRVIQGFCQGFFFPSLHNLLGKWAPVPERSRLATFVFSGGPLGTVIALPVTGWICGSEFGWPMAFYIFGGIGFVWVIVWAIFGANSPADYDGITFTERHYIEATLGVDKSDNTVPPPTPWKEIATSLPVWAILVTHCAQNWGFWTLLTEMPTYMSHMLKFNIKANGMLSALPYFTMWFMSFIFSTFTDFLINREYASIGNARKIANSIGLYIPAIALLALGFFSTSVTMAIVLLIISIGANAAHMCGYQVNHIDLSPTHAGTLMGITNGISNIFSLLAPLLVQAVVTDDHNPSQWSIIFCTSAIFYIVGNTFYVLFGVGEIQKWDSPEPTEETEMDSKNVQPNGNMGVLRNSEKDISELSKV